MSSLNCVRTFCPEKSRHRIFLHIHGKLLNIPVCCECYSHLKKLSNPIQEVLTCIENVAPSPTTDWTTEEKSLFDMKLPKWVDLMMRYLRDLLDQLEMNVMGSFGDTSHITNTLKTVSKNIDYIGHSCQKEDCF